jgi:hypothetical protein
VTTRADDSGNIEHQFTLPDSIKHNDGAVCPTSGQLDDLTCTPGEPTGRHYVVAHGLGERHAQAAAIIDVNPVPPPPPGPPGPPAPTPNAGPGAGPNAIANLSATGVSVGNCGLLLLLALMLLLSRRTPFLSLRTPTRNPRGAHAARTPHHSVRHP